MLKSVFLFAFLLGTFFVGTMDTKLNPEKPTIGVWIAAPRHSSFFNSYENMKNGVNRLADQGINTIFLCAWAEHKTIFESQTLLKHSNYQSLKETSLFQDSKYSESSKDPVRDLIDLAHQKNMKVFFWFEYGFMSKWGAEPTAENDPLLAKQPHWKGLGNDGKGTNYNGTDYYYNSYHPEVQQFIIDLIAEAIDLYPDIDGIQGDDRLPASPANSGYDTWTIEAYQDAHNGKSPPLDYRDSEWFQWRLNILNAFAERMYHHIKSKGNYNVAFSPNIYPWALENLMQDWPTWVKEGNVELLNVQCYRKTFKAYKQVIDDVVKQTEGYLDKNRISPGIILGIASQKMANPASLDSILAYNKKIGLQGQSYFYEKWLVSDSTFSPVIKNNH